MTAGMEILVALPDHNISKDKIEFTKASTDYLKKLDSRTKKIYNEGYNSSLKIERNHHQIKASTLGFSLVSIFSKLRASYTSTRLC